MRTRRQHSPRASPFAGMHFLAALKDLDPEVVGADRRCSGRRRAQCLARPRSRLAMAESSLIERSRPPSRLGVRRRLLRDRPEGPARRPARQGPRAAEPDLLRQGFAGALPRRARELAGDGGRREPRPGLPGRRRVLRRRPDVLRLDPVPGDRRDHSAADRVGQPADVPAGRRARRAHALARARAYVQTRPVRAA